MLVAKVNADLPIEPLYICVHSSAQQQHTKGPNRAPHCLRYRPTYEYEPTSPFDVVRKVCTWPVQLSSFLVMWRECQSDGRSASYAGTHSRNGRKNAHAQRALVCSAVLLTWCNPCCSSVSRKAAGIPWYYKWTGEMYIKLKKEHTLAHQHRLSLVPWNAPSLCSQAKNARTNTPLWTANRSTLCCAHWERNGWVQLKITLIYNVPFLRTFYSLLNRIDSVQLSAVGVISAYFAFWCGRMRHEVKKNKK